MTNLAATPDSTQVTLTWTLITGDANIGYSEITTYSIHQKLTSEADTEFSEVATSLTNTGAVVTGLSTNTAYTFRMFAVNDQGTATLSTDVAATTTQKPDKMDAPVVSQAASSTKVKIEWTEPEDYNASIEEYEVTLIDSTDNYVEKTDLCDGSDTTIRDQLYCEIEMADLKSGL